MTDTQDRGVAQPVETSDPYAGDLVLAELVRLANQLSDDQISITLIVSGLVVSGTLVSNVRFFEALPGQHPGLEAFTELWADRFRELADDGPMDPRGIGFIHLKDAAVFGADGQHLPRSFWRGRIEEVSAWSLGQYSLNSQ